MGVSLREQVQQNRMHIEDLWELMASVLQTQQRAAEDFRRFQLETRASRRELEESLRRLAEAQARTEAELRESRKEVDESLRRLAEEQARTEKGLQRLETEMRESRREVDESLRRLAEEQARTEKGLQRLEAEMRAFKDEMRAFKDEMLEFKEEMRAFKDEMLEFKNEMRAFKDEMQAIQMRAEQERREMARRWGELSNKMGTLAEDLVAPSIPRVLQEVTGCSPEEIEFKAVRVQRRHHRDPGRVKEFDVVVVCNGYVLVNETKSKLRSTDVDDFEKIMREVRAFFPEYEDKRFIGAIATLYMPEEVAKYAERKGLIALGFGEEAMEVLNSPGFKPKEF